mmetsp:Transcript_52317/g.114115  ORF Transcript_52317/g.114115 Transcript_52317/m.114115 type:complete len:228 (+) Transcript_52317:228-911(+)
MTSSGTKRSSSTCHGYFPAESMRFTSDAVAGIKCLCRERLFSPLGRVFFRSSARRTSRDSSPTGARAPQGRLACGGLDLSRRTGEGLRTSSRSLGDTERDGAQSEAGAGLGAADSKSSRRGVGMASIFMASIACCSFLCNVPPLVVSSASANSRTKTMPAMKCWLKVETCAASRSDFSTVMDCSGNRKRQSKAFRRSCTTGSSWSNVPLKTFNRKSCTAGTVPWKAS